VTAWLKTKIWKILNVLWLKKTQAGYQLPKLQSSTVETVCLHLTVEECSLGSQKLVLLKYLQ